MKIVNSYKYEIDGVIYVSGNLPENATVLETMDILVADDGYNLIRKSDNENIGISVWLKNGDTQDNYTETEALKDINSIFGLN